MNEPSERASDPPARDSPVPLRGAPRAAPGYPGCFGCGPDNPHGLALQMYLHGDRVTASWTAPAHLAGWPHVLHGGIAATLLDEVMAWVPYAHTGRHTVTGDITVKYRRQVPIDTQLDLEAWPAREPSGRRWRVAGRIAVAGKTLCEGLGLYLVV